MGWILIILFHLVFFFAVCGGVGLLVVCLIGSLFEQLSGYCRTTAEPNQAQLKREIKKIEDRELAHELELLLSERRMARWWKFVVWLIVTVALYLYLFVLAR
jgi:hypothetical protein